MGLIFLLFLRIFLSLLCGIRDVEQLKLHKSGIGLAKRAVEKSVSQLVRTYELLHLSGQVGIDENEAVV